MEFNVFKLKTPNFEKLSEFGFILENGLYRYSVNILDGQFEMTVTVASDGKVGATVTDLSTSEPYTLHLADEAVGAFVGRVRGEFEDVLLRISESCFERDVFKEVCAKQVIEYARNTYGDELEFLWDKYPAGAILRRKDNRKWYALLMIISKRKVGLDSDGEASVLDLRLDTENDAELVDGKRFFLGYHMNKRTWFSVILDGSVSFDEIRALMDKSYKLAKKK